MQHAVLILPDNRNRLPEVTDFRKAGFHVSSAVESRTVTKAEDSVKRATSPRTKMGAPYLTDR